ncbi:MAG: hypothetical protein ACRC33_07220 [Gemmataceae bacterium]
MPLPRTLMILASSWLLSASAQTGPEEGRPRLKKEEPPGKRVALAAGKLFVPEALAGAKTAPLLVHFHGPGWVAEVAGARHGHVVVSVQLGSGSSKYAEPFKDASKFAELLAEVEAKSGLRPGLVTLSGWSAGYGAVRAILRQKEHYARVQRVILLDGMHAGYLKGTARPIPGDLDSFVTFARDAVAGKKRFLFTHTRIVPPGYASTTETADFVLDQAGVGRAKAAGPGPSGLPLETEACKGGLRVLGCAGATAADHIDHLHALAALLKP